MRLRQNGRTERSLAADKGVIAQPRLGGGHRRALGALVLLLAPPAGHAQTFGKAGCATYPPVDADLEFAVVMHSTLFQSSLLSPHAGCHHLSELLPNQKRLPLAEVAGYAERG